jgi:ABC-type bacteriocin/lantibiotic exporter with double-glycine peptidase domain
MKVDLTPFQQETDYTCLPACIRIVLDFWGVSRTEQEIAQVCRANVAGTLLREAIAGVQQLGFHALRLDNGTFDDLTGYLSQGLPVIVGLAAAVLYPQGSGGHAVVVCGMEQNEVLYVDPISGTEERLDTARFMRAWRQRRGLGLVILGSMSAP